MSACICLFCLLASGTNLFCQSIGSALMQSKQKQVRQVKEVLKVTKDVPRILSAKSIFRNVSEVDEETANNIADKFFSILNKDYIRETRTNDRTDHFIVYFFPEGSEIDGEETIRFYFKKSNPGSNKDLEIEGETLFSLEIIRGKFLDLYPMWEILRSDLVLLPKSKEEIIDAISEVKDRIYGVVNDMTKRTYEFEKPFRDHNDWWLRIHHY